MFDNELMFRTGATNLTVDEAGTYVAVPKQTVPMALRVIVPTMAEANDTISVVVSFSDDGTNAKEVVTMPLITIAEVVAGKTEYFCPIYSHRLYIKVAFDITDADAGADFNAGAVKAGLVPASRYNL